MFKEIKVHSKNENSETIFKATDYEGKNYLYRGTQLIELFKADLNNVKYQLGVIIAFAIFSISNIFYLLEENTASYWFNLIKTREASFGVTLSAPLSILIIGVFLISLPIFIGSMYKDKKKVKFIIKESDGMIEKIHSKPKDMTHYKTEEKTS